MCQISCQNSKRLVRIWQKVKKLLLVFAALPALVIAHHVMLCFMISGNDLNIRGDVLARVLNSVCIRVLAVSLKLVGVFLK